MTSPTPFRVQSLLVAALLMGCSVVHAQPRYTLTDLGAATDPGALTSGIAINARGQVLVAELGRQTAWLHTSGARAIDLSTVVPGVRLPGYTYHVNVQGLNDAGQVIGAWTAVADGRPLAVLGPDAFVWSQPGGPVNLGPAGGRSDLLSINNTGQVLGTFALPRNTFVHQLGTGRTSTDLPADFTGVEINDTGQIAGGITTWDGQEPEFHAAVFDRAGLHDLGTLGGHTAEVTGINNAGWVVGGSDLRGPVDDVGIAVRHPFLYRPGIGMRDLGRLPRHPALTYAMALDINDAGQVVGFQAGHRASGAVAFLFDPSFGLLDLNDRLDPVSGAGWVLQTANGINNRGQITGTGLHEGRARAYLLTPAAGRMAAR